MNQKIDDDIFDKYVDQAADFNGLSKMTVERIASDLCELDSSLNLETAQEYANAIKRILSSLLDQTRSEVLHVRVSPPERMQIEQAAAEAGKTMSNYLRSRILG